MSDDELSDVASLNDEKVESDESDSSDEETIISDNMIINNIEDSNVFRKNYESLKKNNVTSLFLNKYEITKILCKRSEQLESGCIPLIANYERYNNVYDIAFEEFQNKKIPFILKRFINNKYEYFKLEDLKI
tara:strand:- start:213 stop:608 length:396 start_codon:yes stop_codon:yes gene_type:complete